MSLTCSNPTCSEQNITQLNKIKTPEGLKELCNKCAALHFQGKLSLPKPTVNQIPEVFPDSRAKEQSSIPSIQEDLQKQVSPVSNPNEVPHPTTGKKMKLEDLYSELLADTQLKIDKLFEENDAGTAYSKLETWIQAVESVAFEAKTRAAVMHQKKRGIDATSGKSRWDKERRGENKNNLSDPRNSPLLSDAQKKHKYKLTKLETVIKGMIDLDMSDTEIIDMCTVKNFKGSEVREAIQKFRG